jgi:hypothetical protein
MPKFDASRLAGLIDPIYESAARPELRRGLMAEFRTPLAPRGIDTLATNEPGRVLDWVMQPISYARHRFPPDIIRHAVWLYLRFTLSYRDVEDLLAERGLMVSNESIRRWDVWSAD